MCDITPTCEMPGGRPTGVGGRLAMTETQQALSYLASGFN